MTMRLTPDILTRTAIAALAALFVFVCANGGVSLHGWLGVVQVGVICGVVAGALAPRPWAAFAAGMIAGFLGGFAFIAWFIGGDLGMSAAFTVVTALVALGSRLLLDRTRVTSLALALVAVALVVAGMWAVTWQSVTAPQPGGAPTTLVKLSQQPVPGQQWGDGTLFRAIVDQMRHGTPYYAAFKWGYDNDGFTMRDPNNVIQVRTPTIFYIWAAEPGWPTSLVWSLLVLASVACVACVGVANEVVDPTLGAAGAAAVGAYAMATAESPNNITAIEVWAGLLGVLVLFAFLRSLSSERRRAWAVAAALLALLAFAVRELMIFLPVAGVFAAFFSAKENRRFDLALWGSTLAASLALWGAHLAAASRITSSVGSGVVSTWLGGGGPAFMLHGISYNSVLLAAAWVPFALVAMGVIGAFAQSSVQAKAFSAFAGLSPLAAFLVVGNAALSRDLVLHQPLNYWGAIVVPLLLALAPTSFALLPGLRRPVSIAAPASRLPEPATSL